jgi:hypothetical protein
MKMRYTRLSLFLAAGVLCAQDGREVTRNVNLLIVDQLGKPLGGVIAVLVDEPVSGPPRYRQFKAESDNRGNVAYPRLPEGRYRVCVASPKDKIVGSCQWGNRPTFVTSDAASESRGPLRVPVGLATTLRITIDDDDGAITAAVAAREPETFIAINVWNEEMGQNPMLEVSRHPNRKRVYELNVPGGRKYRMRVLSPSFAIEDKRDRKRVDLANGDVDVDVPGDGKDVDVGFVSKGRKPKDAVLK